MRRLLKKIFKSTKPEPLTKEEARRIIERLSKECDIPLIIFDTKEAADQLMKDLVAASTMRAHLKALGLEVPEVKLN